MFTSLSNRGFQSAWNLNTVRKDRLDERLKIRAAKQKSYWKDMRAIRQKFQGDKTPLDDQYTMRDYLPELNRVGKTILEDETSCWTGSSLKVIAAVWKGISKNCNDTAFTFYSTMESGLVRFILGVLKSDDIDMVASALKIVVNMTATVTAVCDNLIGKKLFRYLNAVIAVCVISVCTFHLFCQIDYISYF